MTYFRWIAGYALYLILFILGADYTAYRLYLHRISFEPNQATQALKPPLGVDGETMKRLGWLLTDKTSSFIHFQARKSPGKIRVGCFGDSFTYGDEVGRADDYPSLLQKEFKKEGYRNVEVINFGNSGYGFHQTYLLWDQVGRNYGLDYILLGPVGFQPERDNTFNHSLESPWPFHSRYILSNGSVERVDPLGDTAEERLRQYLRFFPAYRYLRYDHRAPSFLSCWLPADRILANPFYYSSVKDEIRKTQMILLRRMADSGANILIGHYRDGLVRKINSLNIHNIHAVTLKRFAGFPYQASGSHHSAWGNNLVAHQMFCLLTGQTSCQLETLQFHNRDESVNVRFPSPRLDDYDYIGIDMHPGRKGEFFTAGVMMKAGQQGVHQPEPSLIAFSKKGHSWAESIFATWNKPLLGGEIVAVKTGRDAYPFGAVRLVWKGLNMGAIDSVDPWIYWTSTGVYLKPKDKLSGLLAGKKKAWITLQDEPWLALSREENGQWQLLPEPHRLLTLEIENPGNLDDLPPKGSLSLVLRKYGRQIVVPVSDWRKQSQVISYRAHADFGHFPRP